MLNLPRSLYQRRTPRGPGGPGGPGMGGGPGRLAQMNPGVMARLMRARSPQPQPQGQPMPAPQVPFQGGDIGSGQDASAGMPDFSMMQNALKSFQGMMGNPAGVGDVGAMGMDEMGLEAAQGFGPPTGMAAPGFGGGAGAGAMAGMDPAQMAGIMKMLPMLLAA